MDFCSIKQLSNLLNVTENESSSSDDDLPPKGLRHSGPGDIGKSQTKFKRDESTAQRLPTSPNDIWDLNEVPCSTEMGHSDILDDPRDQPEYDIRFRQMVGTEDIFLQIGNKTPMTASCEILSVTVNLPGEVRENVDCEISDTNVDIRSPMYRLSLPLPHTINTDLSKADWDSAKSQLCLTLYLSREYDAVNF